MTEAPKICVDEPKQADLPCMGDEQESATAQAHAREQTAPHDHQEKYRCLKQRFQTLKHVSFRSSKSWAGGSRRSPLRGWTWTWRWQRLRIGAIGKVEWGLGPALKERHGARPTHETSPSLNCLSCTGVPEPTIKLGGIKSARGPTYPGAQVSITLEKGPGTQRCARAARSSRSLGLEGSSVQIFSL